MDARETVNHDPEPEAAQPSAAGPTPEPDGGAPAPAGLGRSLGGLPNHPTAHSLRQTSALNAQQRQGNATVQRMVRGLMPVQRVGPNDGTGGAGGGGGDGGAGGAGGDRNAIASALTFRGHTLTNDGEACATALETIAKEKAIAGAEDFVNAFNSMAGEHWNIAQQNGQTPNTGGQRGAGPSTGVPIAEVNLEQALKPKLASALTSLKARRDDLVAAFDGLALNVMGEMLNASEKKLQDEAERYGITLTGDAPSRVMGDSPTAVGAPAGGGPTFDWKETPDDALLAAAAEELRPMRAKLDKLLDERKELVSRTGQQSSVTGAGGAPNSGPEGSGGQQGTGGGASPEDLKELDRVNYDLGKTQFEFDELRKKKEAEFPILAAFTGQGQAGALGNIGKDSANAAGTVAPLIATQLANIANVRAGIAGKEVKVWALPTIVEGTKSQLNMGSETLGGRLIDEWAADKKSTNDLINLAVGVIAIGLGILAAVPTGGASLAVAGAVGAASGATAIISTWQGLTALKDYQLAKAMNATDPDKAKVISAEDPSLIWLAMDIVGAVLDLKAAVGVFKNIANSMRRVVVSGANVRAATVGNPLAEISELADLKAACDAAKKPGLFERVMAQVGHTEDPIKIKAAIEDAYKAVGQEARLAAGKSRVAMPPAMRGMTAAAQGADEAFDASKRTAEWLLDHVRGEIPDIAKGWIKEGKVRPLTAETLMQDFGHLPSQKTRDGVSAVFSYADDLIEDGYLSHGGFYDAIHGRVYLGAQSGEAMAEGLIHEAEHRLKHLVEKNKALAGGLDEIAAEEHARQALVGFESEVQAAIAQRDFLLLTFRTPGGARYGKQAEFATPAMMDLMNADDAALMAQVESYYTRTMGANASRYTKPADLENINPIAQGIYDDIAARQEALRPPAAGTGPVPNTGPRATNLPDDEVTKVHERPAGSGSASGIDDEPTGVYNKPQQSGPTIDDEPTGVYNKPQQSGPSIDDEPTGVYNKPQQNGPTIDDEPTLVDDKPPDFDPDDEVTKVK